MTRTLALPLFVIASLAAGCGSSEEDGSATSGSAGSTGTGGDGSMAVPTVTSVSPIDGATDVPTNASASATFSAVMDCSTLTDETFTLTYGAPASKVPGTVVCGGSTAVFWPSGHLASDVTFTAAISTAAASLAGLGLATSRVWSFTSGDSAAPGLPVDLGTAGDYAILAKSAISTVPTSAITGNLGLSPAAASFITGFSLTADTTNVFATSPQVTGKVYAANYALPTPGNLTAAVGDMQIAFTDAAARAADVTELGAGNIGGMTLAAGVYKWGTGLLIPTDVTLDGSASDVWIFQVAQDLTVGSGAQVGLSGGALAKNVFWQVAGLVDVGTTAHLEGVVLTQTAISLHTGASVNGRLLAQTAVNLDGNAVVQPAP